MHLAIFLPPCTNLEEAVTDLLQEEEEEEEGPVFIFPDTSEEVLNAVIHFVYCGFCKVSSAEKCEEVFKILQNLGIFFSQVSFIKHPNI